MRAMRSCSVAGRAEKAEGRVKQPPGEVGYTRLVVPEAMAVGAESEECMDWVARVAAPWAGASEAATAAV